MIFNEKHTVNNALKLGGKLPSEYALATELEEYIPTRHTGSTEEETDTIYANLHVNAADGTHYRKRVRNSFDHSLFGGTQYLVEGYRVTAEYGWQKTTSYTAVGYPVTYEREIAKGVWGAWKKANDGGNADTVDGYHASELVQNHTTRLTESTTLASLHSLVSADGAKIFHYVTSASGTLPSDFPSSLLTDATISSMFDVTVKRIGGNGYYTIEGVFTTGAPYKVEGYLTSTFYWRRMFDSTGGALSGPIDAMHYTVNNGIGFIGASDLGTSSETALDVIRNGKRTRLDVIRHDDDRIDAQLASYDGTNWDRVYQLLHSGNSKAVAVSDTAPTDTSAVWFDTSEL